MAKQKDENPAERADADHDKATRVAHAVEALARKVAQTGGAGDASEEHAALVDALKAAR